MRKPLMQASPLLLSITVGVAMSASPAQAAVPPLASGLAASAMQADAQDDSAPADQADDPQEDPAADGDAAAGPETPADDADGAGDTVNDNPADDSAADDNPADGSDANAAADGNDGNDGTPDADSEPDRADADPSDDAGNDEEPVSDDNFADDGWAAGWNQDASNEADDAIPLDRTRPKGQTFVVRVPAHRAGQDMDSVDTGSLLPVAPRNSRMTGHLPRKPGRAARPGDDDDSTYSYGGRPVSALSVPWQAQIFYPSAPPKPGDTRAPWQRQHYCGGALIAPGWVLTAAHCMDQQMVDLGFKVRLGALDISRNDGATYRIDRIVRHSQYNPDSTDVTRPPNMYANDIALVHIVSDGRPVAIDGSRIRQIPINRKPLPSGIPVSATGWGVTGTENNDVINAVMLRVDLQLMPNVVCQQRPGYGPQKIQDGVFCASNPVQSTCRGDSGGPVVLTNGSPLLVGLVSWGKRKCAGDGRPGVYTRIDRYAQWIDQAMKLPQGRNSLP